MDFYPADDLRNDVICLQLDHTCGAQPEKHWVPAYYFKICLPDGRKIGTCSLRIGHNEKTYVGGNIGYGIDEPYRGHHYAAEACTLLFRQARKHQMDEVIITCDPGNRASSRTCELAGGEYLETVPIPEDNEMFAEGKRYAMIWQFDLSFRIDAKRVRIQKFTLDMAQDVYENSLDEETRRFVPDEVFESVDAARDVIASLIQQDGGRKGPLVYPVFIRANGRNIGYVELVPLEQDGWEIGFHIARQYRGQGYATEAVQAFLPVITDAMGIREVFGICHTENAASRHVLKNCGFQTMDQEKEQTMVKSIWRKEPGRTGEGTRREKE